jgi:hypothetical protein
LDLDASMLSATDWLTVGDGVVTLSNASTITISAGPAQFCPDPNYPETVAELHIYDADSRLEAGDFHMCAGSVLSSEGTVALTGSLTFANTQESAWSWGAFSVLELNGGVGVADYDPSAYVRLEIGGEDLGDDPNSHVGDPNGFVSNFELSELVIGPGAHVSLEDLVDNGNRDGMGGPAEALYVDRLAFADPDGRLVLNGLHLYFNTLAGESSQICDSPPLFGDLDGDGTVGLSDLATLLGNYGEPGPWSYEDGDLDADGDIDLYDLAALLAVYGTTRP